MPRPDRILPVIIGILLLAGGVGCARPHPHVALPDVSLGEPSFFPTLEAYAGAPIVGGNAVQVLLNGEEIFPAMLEAIHSARRTISYAQYFYEDGPVSRDMAQALAERCRAGVGVNVLLDGFGTLAMPMASVRRSSRAAQKSVRSPATSRSRSPSGCVPSANSPMLRNQASSMRVWSW